MRRPRLPWLLRELLEAHRLIRQPYYVEGFRRCGIDIGGGLILGLAAVEVDDDNYMPAPGGKGALIIPYFAGNVLLDLIAVGLETFACRTRAGVCTVLGGEHIERAREQEMAVRLFKDPIDWLRNARRGACIVDWRAAPHVLADIPGISCGSEFLASRVDCAMRQPVAVPPIFIREPANAA